LDVPTNIDTSTPPVKDGEEYNLSCEAQGAKGDGICKVERYIIFVEGAQIGKRYKVLITKATQKCGFGKIVGDLLAEE